MTAPLVMSRRDRAALADAIRDMRRAGIKSRELIRATGAKPGAIYELNRREVRK